MSPLFYTLIPVLSAILVIGANLIIWRVRVLCKKHIDAMELAHITITNSLENQIELEKAKTVSWKKSHDRLALQYSEVTCRLLRVCDKVDQSGIRPVIPERDQFTFYRNEPEVMRSTDGGGLGHRQLEVEHGKLVPFRFEVDIFVPDAPIRIQEEILLGAVMAHGALMFKNALMKHNRRI